MKLYHGSTEIIKQPIILEKQRLLDFGKGFYVTTSQEQAEQWAVIKQKRLSTEVKAIVNVYQFDEHLLTAPRFNIKQFTQANEEWLLFILQNRNKDTQHPYDIVTGPVANDTLYQTLSLYEAEILTLPETISRLKAHRLFDQISFNTEAMITELKFEHHYEYRNNVQSKIQK